MVWIPPNYIDTCQANPSLNSCQSGILTFLTLISQYLSHSNDNAYTTPENDYNNREFDFIIVGAGAAGCVVANRLSEITNWKILLIEAGEEEPFFADIPTTWPSLFGSSIDYAYQTEPEPQTVNPKERKSFTYPSGKVMGGSSSINGMAYVRGNKQDFNDWESFGNKGWGWEDVIHYFIKSEDMKDRMLLTENPSLHGVGGYLKVDRSPVNDKNAQALLDGWQEIGLAEIDYNTGNQFGSSKAQYTAFKGIRQSTNEAFIRPIRKQRSNLTIKSNSRVTKIVIDRNTKRAIGVEYISNEEKEVVKTIYARKEVIISSGFVGSPKILLLSGIGPADDLEDLKIDVVNDLPVGRSLQDHTYVTPIILQVNNSVLTVPDSKTIKDDVFDWLNNRQGKLSNFGSVGVTAFYQSPFEQRPGVVDIQYFTLGVILDKFDQSSFNFIPDCYYDTIALSVMLVAPKSQGYLKLSEENPRDNQPRIHFNYLNDTQDVKVLIEGLKFARKIVTTKSFKDQGLVELKVPAVGCEEFGYESNNYFECFVKKHFGPGNHGVGTCKMGPGNDSNSVVDSTLKVHGVIGLRVIDASIMPSVTRGNPMAATIMIAEKGSDMIKKEWL